MTNRTWLGVAIAWCAVVLTVPITRAENVYRLKPGGSGKVCLDCHDAFTAILASPFVHTPVKSGECAACHNPHTSDHSKLLAAGEQSICTKCHQDLIPKTAASSHPDFLAGNCVKCHDPHASKNKNQLVQTGNALCRQCHKEMMDAAAKAKIKHQPVEKNCLECHDPHFSAANASLLKQEPPGLCKKCHDPKQPAFQQKHNNYPVSESRCTACHNVHGSDQNGMLYNNVHAPVAKKMCKQCHGEQKPSGTAVKFTMPSAEVCKTCHAKTVTEMLKKNRVHWPVVQEKGCLNCHEPHASNFPGLTRGSQIETCGRCHEDTIERHAKSVTKHQPIAEGKCTACHSPHSSDNQLLFSNPSVLEVCGGCHDWQKHSTHPVGDKVRDPRNRNLPVDCLSCHRAHGTEFPHLFPFSTNTDLCVQCHVQFKR